MDREDMKHHITMLLTEGRLHLAPIGNSPHRVLDIGTGTGNSLQIQSTRIQFLTSNRYLANRVW